MSHHILATSKCLDGPNLTMKFMHYSVIMLNCKHHTLENACPWHVRIDFFMKNMPEISQGTAPHFTCINSTR